MPVQSKPSLRSSSRKVQEVPPPDLPQNPLPIPRRGKRTRDHSLDSESNTSVKKQKNSPPIKADRALRVSKGQTLKSLPLRDKADAVTSRSADPPPPKSNGFTTTTSNTTYDYDGQEKINENTCNISPTNTINKSDKRSLRSHDGGSRSKSELALYFPNYDELVSIEPKEPGES